MSNNIPTEVTHLIGERIEVCASEMVDRHFLDNLVVRVDHDFRNDAYIIHAAASVAAFGELQTTETFYFHADWLEMLRDRVRERWPWLGRVVREGKKLSETRKMKTFKAACPHVGDGYKGRQGCVEWVYGQAGDSNESRD